MDNTLALVTSSTEKLLEKGLPKELHLHLLQRLKNDRAFKWMIVGSAVYISVRLTNFNVYGLWYMKRFFELWYNKLNIPNSVLIWMGEMESEIPFGRLGYTRCLEADFDVLEKYGLPMNTEKCLRDGLQFIPGELYPQFDLNEFDPKVTPLAWSYGPIADPSLIMPIGWYNDMCEENHEFELFCRFLKVFGYLPQSCYEELYKHCKIRLLRSNQRLIRIGDPDDKVYIIIQGAVDVYTNRIGPHTDFIRLRTATRGGHLASLFSVVDVITGHSRCIKSIYAVSKLNTTKVLIFPIAALKDYLVRNSEYLVSAIIRMLERVYRFQYQIMHVALHLTTACSILDPEPPQDPLEVEFPEGDDELSDKIKDDAIRSFMNFLEMDYFEAFKQHCTVVVLEPEPNTIDVDVIKASVLNQTSTAYKYIYVGKVEEFYLKSNLSPMDQQARRKIIEETMVPEPFTRFHSGDGIGSLTGILGYSNVLFSRCIEKSIIVTIDRMTLERILAVSPVSILSIASVTVSRMSSFMRAMDFAIECTSAHEGQYIYHKEQMCYDSYLILSGRARSYQLDSETQHRAIIEYKENDWMGVIESLLQSKRRSKTCVVIRETEFVKIPNDLLRNSVINYSSAAQVLLNFLVQRTMTSSKFGMQVLDFNEEWGAHGETRRIHSIALVPVSEALPYSVLAMEIKRHFTQSDKSSCVIVTFEKMLRQLRKPEMTVRDQFMLEMLILKHLENNDLVIFICVPRMHYWNQVCSTYSEIIFTVGTSELPNISTIPPDFEEEVVGKKISSRRKELIVLHSVDTVLPRNTKEWLHCRDWIHFHHHIRLPNEAFSFLGSLLEEEIEAKYKSLNRNIVLTSDLSRFLRWIHGKTFGVLFSSGGARIGAQLGMLEALVEYEKIPIDMVIGTGVGFLLAACYAIYQDYNHVQKIIEKVFKNFKDLTKIHWSDITFPYINLGKGKRILTFFYQLFGSVQLEDAWIPICCVTTSLTSQDVRVDRSGPVWTFVRASLSHITNSPPISDPTDQDYICDGAHANSLPHDVIKEYGAEYIIALNTVGGKLVGNPDSKADPNISVLRFIKKILYSVVEQFGLASPSFETVFEQLALTQTRMYAAGAETVTNLKYVVYVRPPVEHIPSQSWRNLPTLHRIGYFYMKAILDKNPYREDIPFNDFWTNIKNSSTELAREGGRDLNYFNR